MKITDWTMDPRNSRVVRWLQSRPVQYVSKHSEGGYAYRCAVWLDTAGYLSPKQIAILEEKMGYWVEPAPETVWIDERIRTDERGPHIRAYVTPGHSPGAAFQDELVARLGLEERRIGLRWVHDPVYKSISESDNYVRPHRFLCSLGSWELPGTGLAETRGDIRRHADSADLLNEVVSPALSTADSVFEFRNAKVGKGSTAWWVFAERRSRTASDGALAPLPEIRRAATITSLD